MLMVRLVLHGGLHDHIATRYRIFQGFAASRSSARRRPVRERQNSQPRLPKLGCKLRPNTPPALAHAVYAPGVPGAPLATGCPAGMIARAACATKTAQGADGVQIPHAQVISSGADIC